MDLLQSYCSSNTGSNSDLDADDSSASNSNSQNSNQEDVEMKLPTSRGCSHNEDNNTATDGGRIRKRTRKRGRRQHKATIESNNNNDSDIVHNVAVPVPVNNDFATIPTTTDDAITEAVAADPDNRSIFTNKIIGVNNFGCRAAVDTSSSNVIMQCQCATASNDNNNTESSLFIRSKPHIVGNWSGHVYCTIHLSKQQLIVANIAVHAYQRVLQQQGLLQKSIDSNRRKRHRNMPICLIRHFCYHCCCSNQNNDNNRAMRTNTQNEFHMSLSRPFYLQYSNLDSFIRTLSKNAQQQRQQFNSCNNRMIQLEVPFNQSYVQSRNCQSKGMPKSTTTTKNMTEKPNECSINENINKSSCFDILYNEDRTRAFLVWRIRSDHIDDPNNATASSSVLSMLVQNVDNVLKLYQQPQYYNPPIFHITLASHRIIADTHSTIDEVDELDDNERTIRKSSMSMKLLNAFNDIVFQSNNINNSDSNIALSSNSDQIRMADHPDNDDDDDHCTTSSGDSSSNDDGDCNTIAAMNRARYHVHTISRIYCKFGLNKIYTIDL